MMENGLGKFCYYKVKMPALFDDRDFLTENYKTDTIPGYKLVLSSFSTTHSSKPETKKFTRAEMFLNYFFVKSLTRSTCEVSFLVGMDPKGNITPAIFEMFS